MMDKSINMGFILFLTVTTFAECGKVLAASVSNSDMGSAGSNGIIDR